MRVIRGVVAAACCIVVLIGAGPGGAQESGKRPVHELRLAQGPAEIAVGIARGPQEGDTRDTVVTQEVRLRLPDLPLVGVPAGPGVPSAPGGSSVTLPNLSPLPLFDVHVGPADYPAEGPPHAVLGEPVPGAQPATLALRFTTVIRNVGRHSFELLSAPAAGAPEPGQVPVAARQCVGFSGLTVHGARRGCQSYREVGSADYHPAHHHLHAPGFIRYELRRDVNGRIQPGPGGLVGAGDGGLCLGDMVNWRRDPGLDTDNATLQGAGEQVAPWYERGWYRECGSIGASTAGPLRQGLSPGWLSIIPPGYPGQQIPMRGVRDGVYWLVVTVGRASTGGLKLWETNGADNAAAARIQVYGGGTKARLLSPAPPKDYDWWFDNPHGQPGH